MYHKSWVEGIVSSSKLDKRDIWLFSNAHILVGGDEKRSALPIRGG